MVILSSAKHLAGAHSPSEFEPHRDLSVARVARGTGDSSKIGISQKRIRCPEASVVCEVEELRAEFEFHALMYGEVLEEPHVNILDPLSSCIGGEPRSVPRHLVERSR